ncbi:MAG: pyruvate flavodoxin/ferredoxin oxidoreductase domain-containing protein [Deltaproteobacteria bacterium CSP1-8]|nr:MAG: pyruvate flavodoxin/ferredoxin oxidoreductase domain-containing protein [Deltaproteobacteria bacterium CSP1-8]
MTLASAEIRRELMKGNEAICVGAIAAGCRFYYGYPITPQNDIPEYMSAHLPPIGGMFLQAESEVATINFLLGTSASGMRVMTSSSGPGISLMQEGLSYMAGSELPAVIVNISRSGPGLGGIAPSQGDYFQAVKCGGHGGYRMPVLAPHSVQEMYSLTMLAFDLADKYRNPALILGDAIIGQMKEPFVPTPYVPTVPQEKPWALTGCAGRPRQNVKSLYLKDNEIEVHNWKLHRKYRQMQEEEVRFEPYRMDGAGIVIVAFGTAARVSKTAIQWARKEGLPVGMLRPISLFPFPSREVDEAAAGADVVLVIEMNTGQMLEDVRMSTRHHDKIRFLGKPCAMPTPEEIHQEIRRLAGEIGVKAGNAR